MEAEWVSCVVWLCGLVGTDGAGRALLGHAALGMGEARGQAAKPGRTLPAFWLGEASFLELGYTRSEFLPPPPHGCCWGQAVLH